jgi:enoyl-CoA hydratase/carnithine racemase
MDFAEYQQRFKTARLSRDEHGVLTVQLHSKGDSLRWGHLPHRELAELFMAIARDRENRVMILTGTGEHFITMPADGAAGLARGSLGSIEWDKLMADGALFINSLLAIDIPIIAAVNGPVSVHSELAVLSDIVLATDKTYFQDAGHFPGGLVPGDSVHIIWPLLLGPNRGRYFLLTGQKLSADEAHALGVVAEVLPQDNLMGRAMELAVNLADRNPILLRNTRHTLIRPLRRAMEQDLHVGLALEALAAISGAEWYGREVES